MQKITPFLSFRTEAGEALNFYKEVFKDLKIKESRNYPPGSPGGLEGQLMTATFELFGQDFMVLNGMPPDFKFTEAISFFVYCDDQEEIDRYWDMLGADGGQELMCGWIKDKFGVTWQIVPRVMGELLFNKDKEKSNRAFQAMMKMKKLDIAGLKAAAEGK